MDGGTHAGKTIYEMISSIQSYLRKSCQRDLHLIDQKGCSFRTLNSALNFTLKARASEGIRTDCQEARLTTLVVAIKNERV